MRREILGEFYLSRSLGDKGPAILIYRAKDKREADLGVRSAGVALPAGDYSHLVEFLNAALASAHGDFEKMREMIDLHAA